MAVKVGLKYIEIWNDSLENAVVKYESEEIQKGKIVFYGPSNFTRWKSLSDDILGASGAKCVINRGFGSSCAEHQLYYYPRMIRPLEPKVLVYSFAGNDSAFGYSAEEAWELAQRVIAYARTDFPDIKIYLQSFGPGRNEPNVTAKMGIENLNSLIKLYADNTPNCYYADVKQCEPLVTRKDIYLDDGVHFNEKGYEIYADFYRSVLKDELAEF